MRTIAEDSMRRQSRRRLHVGVALLVVVTSAVVWVVFRDHPAETAVKAFFEALRADDTEAARALVFEAYAPEDHATAFLGPEAVKFPWDTTQVEVVESDKYDATVTVTIETAAKTEHVEYEVVNFNGDWLLDSPFIVLTFDAVPFDYGQVNDAVVPFELSDLGVTLPYVLFPGEYEFYRSIPGTAEIESGGPSTLVTPSRDYTDYVEIGPPRIRFEPEAVADIQQAVDDRMIECLASSETNPEDCPFWHYDQLTNADGEVLIVDSVLEWSLEEPVTINIGEYEAGGNGFPIEHDLAGRPVSLTGIAVNESAGGTLETFATHCALDFSGWLVTLTSDGERIGLDLNVLVDVFHPLHREQTTCDIEL